MAGRRAIGRFEIESEAASGAAGTVYRAVDGATGLPVALKLIRGLGGTEAARFEREARILAKIRHPGVVRYVEHGRTDDGQPYLVMEWLEGEDVRHRLARAGFSIDEAVTLALRVAQALDAVHAQGLVHRDLKPANLFLPGGHVEDAKLIDFGLVRPAFGSGDVTGTGLIVGTPSYMAPEQARGQRDVDARADVFSLGCVLFKCLTGHAPFEGRSVLAVLTKVLLEEAPPLRRLRPQVPAALDELVAAMLAKDVAGRPQSALAVVQALLALGPLGPLGEEREPAPPSNLASGLTTGEQRVTAMILVGASIPERPASPESPARAPDVRALVDEHGGQLDTLVDGTRVITVAATGVATDQAARAARCALALRAVLPGAPMAIAMGRSEVSRRQPVGEAIERAALLLAARVQGAVEALASGLASPPIALDDVTAALLDPRFDVARGGDGWSLLGVRTVDTRERTLLGRLTPMVGREWELRSLEATFRACLEEPEARAVLVTGAAGMGKSRLAHEAVRALRRGAPDLQVWWGRGDPLRAGSPLGLLGELIRGAAGVQEGEALDARRRRLAERVAAWLPARDAAWVTELLGELADAPFPDDTSVALRAARQDPRIMSEQLRAAWEALVNGACTAGPLLIVLEDLHWADAATLRLIGNALGTLARRPWLVLALARDELHDTFPRLWEGRSVEEIRLAPLPRRAAVKLARQVLGDAAGPATIERIVAQADGNAFYLEELIRAVADGRGPRKGDLPETVLAMVQARLEGLDADTRRLLRAASIFGEVFWPDGVAALLGGTEPRAGWVDRLLEHELIAARSESRFARQPELAFRHALLREGAYAMLTAPDRALGHLLAGEWLERHGESDPLVLAQHFELAADPDRAASFYRAAAAQALRAADVDTAIARTERALAHATAGPARLECLSLLCEAHGWRDEWSLASARADEVIALAAPGSAPWIHAHSIKQSAALTLGRADELMGAVISLTTTPPAPDAAEALVPALVVSVFVLCLASQLGLAAGVLAQIEAIVAATPAPQPLAVGSMSLAQTWVAAWGPEGDAWSALAHALRARACAEETYDAHHARFAHVFVAMSQWSLGLLPEAEAELTALGPLDDHDIIGVLAGLYLALVLIERGALPQARVLVERRLAASLARDQADGGVLRQAENRWLLGEIAARAGDLPEAERQLERAVDPLRITALAWQVAAARLVEVRLALGRLPEALTLSRELLEALTQSGGHGLRGTLLRLVHAEALHASGEPAQAHAALRLALEDLRERAARIADPLVRARFLADVPENARVLRHARAWLGE